MNISLKTFDVSVIIAIYNSKKFFMRALDSVFNQSYKDYEIIIVDDGSSDGIETEMFTILKSNPDMKYIRHSNMKHPLSLNAGIVNSSGKLISFLDSDDEYKTEYLERRVNFFSKNSEIDLVYSPAEITGEDKDLFVPDAKDPSRLIHLEDCIIGGTFFGKKKVFDELEGFKNVYSHDSEFYERAQKKFDVVKFDSRDYIYHRDNPESVISKLKKEKHGQ